jgi:thioredoxin reductase
MAEYSITRALVELKKINKEIEQLTPNMKMFIATGDNKKIPNINFDEAQATTQAQYDQIVSRIIRYSKIQNAIHESNAKTLVMVGGKEMTVLEAINLKKVGGFKQDLLNRLTALRSRAILQKDQTDQKMEDEISTMAQSLAGSGNTVKQEQLDVARVSVEKNKKAEIVSLSEVNKQIEDLQKEVNDIESELDFILSESNAITKITIVD